MSSSAFHTQHIQRRVIRILVATAILLTLVATPLILFDELRLDIAHELGLAPGKGAERLAEGDDGAILVVLPLGDYQGVGREQYRYEAAYIARPADTGYTLTDIESDATIALPLFELSLIAADADGAHILFRGPSADSGEERAALVTREAGTVDLLPEGQDAPDLPGDWETPVWAKVVGTCDRISPHERFIACFNRAEIINYMAGNWQVDVQLFGNFHVSEPVYRGLGFRPILGFAHDDTWLYFQNETGIYRIEIPQSLQAHSPVATPQGTPHNP